MSKHHDIDHQLEVQAHKEQVLGHDIQKLHHELMEHEHRDEHFKHEMLAAGCLRHEHGKVHSHDPYYSKHNK